MNEKINIVNHHYQLYIDNKLINMININNKKYLLIDLESGGTIKIFSLPIRFHQRLKEMF